MSGVMAVERAAVVAGKELAVAERLASGVSTLGRWVAKELTSHASFSYRPPVQLIDEVVGAAKAGSAPVCNLSELGTFMDAAHRGFAYPAAAQKPGLMAIGGLLRGRPVWEASIQKSLQQAESAVGGFVQRAAAAKQLELGHLDYAVNTVANNLRWHRGLSPEAAQNLARQAIVEGNARAVSRVVGHGTKSPEVAHSLQAAAQSLTTGYGVRIKALTAVPRTAAVGTLRPTVPSPVRYGAPHVSSNPLSAYPEVQYRF